MPDPHMKEVLTHTLAEEWVTLGVARIGEKDEEMLMSNTQIYSVEIY